MIFFFQAEDGIRDLVRSRGLGDVYKRQAHVQPEFRTHLADPAQHMRQGRYRDGAIQAHVIAVSYTHLTLPTSDLV